MSRAASYWISRVTMLGILTALVLTLAMHFGTWLREFAVETASHLKQTREAALSVSPAKPLERTP